MSKKHKKPQKVNMKKKNDNTIIIDGMNLLRHRKEGFNPTPFKTGQYLSEKDRPRDKSYKKFNDDDY